MDWEAMGAIAGILGTIFAFVSIIIAVWSERRKQNSIQVNETSESKVPFFRLQKPSFSKRTDESPSSPVRRYSGYDNFFDSYKPFRYILIGLLGGLGGTIIVLIPLLFGDDFSFNCCTGPLLIMGLVSGVVLALIMDASFTMEKASPFLRYSLAFISGLIAGWVGIIVISLAAIIGSSDSSSTNQVTNQQNNINANK